MAPTERARRTFEDLAEELAGSGAVASQMFGMPTLKVSGKAFAGIPGSGGMVFKLSADDVQASLRLTGAELFDPGGMGRPMREWVVVPSSHATRWPELGRAACAYVAATGAKKRAAGSTAGPANKPSTRPSTKKPT
jgi:hypothetical protein